MAFRIEGIRNFAADQGYPDTPEIIARAKAAAEEFDPGAEMFSGGKIEEVLGSADRVNTYMEKRETNLARYT